MNWDAIAAIAAIAAIGTILGTVAVLVTLVYLSTQIRQTNDISRFGTSKDIMDKFDSLNGLIVADSELRQAMVKNSTLSEDENEQLYTFVNMWCNTWMICQAAYDNGLIDEDWYASAKRDVPFELKRWPNFRMLASLWLDRYPEFRKSEIFLPVEENR